MDVDRLEEELKERELTDWWAFYKLEPWDLSRIEEIAARAVSSVITKQADEKKLYPFLHRDFDYQAKQKEKQKIQRTQRSGKPETSEETKALMAMFDAIARREAGK